jgi:MFS transporter, putative metabolite:H+ symporter
MASPGLPAESHGMARREPVLAPVAHRSLAREVLNRTVIVSALGYFVDIYDLLLFSIVRIPSLRGLGVPEAQLLASGVFLLNMQMAGLLVGGLLWGVLGDKRGRVSVLFGSIALYSVANIANAFVTDVNTYAALRFVAGVGLAGELGAAITLVSEVMRKETRGYGTAVVSGVGILGALLAGTVGLLFPWQTAFLVGGALGLALLVTRIKMADSGMFKQVSQHGVRRGDLRMLITDRARFAKYVKCVLIGLPIWFVVGILITFSPEIARELGVAGTISAGTAVMLNYAAAAMAGFGSGALSQRLRTRWWVVLGSIAATAVFVFAYAFARGVSAEVFYALTFLLGISTGYWSVFVTVASEQFGTNLRATVTTTVPNFIRGSVVPITLAFQALGVVMGLARAALIVGVACMLIALLALRGLDETYGKDLDYIEADAVVAAAPVPSPVGVEG